MKWLRWVGWGGGVFLFPPQRTVDLAFYLIRDHFRDKTQPMLASYLVSLANDLCRIC